MTESREPATVEMNGRIMRKSFIAIGIVAVVCLAYGSSVASADTVAISLSATVGPNGTTVFVNAPGCQPTPPGGFDIFVQARNATTGEVGEGAVAAGVFTTVGQGAVTIPVGTPVDSFLLAVSCNGGTLTASQAFTIGLVPAAPVSAAPSFTG